MAQPQSRPGNRPQPIPGASDGEIADAPTHCSRARALGAVHSN